MKNSKGFTLLEVAIAISIIGVICGGLMSYFSVINKIKYEKITRDNIETVAIALAAFVAQNYRLPKASDTFNGEEGSNNGHYVPYKAIGIANKIAKDAHGVPLIYAVEQELTNNFDCIHENDITSYGFCRKISKPAIVVNHTNNSHTAFVIDVSNGGIEFQQSQINVTPKEYTFWISKNMLLMKYLRIQPCDENMKTKNKPMDLNTTQILSNDNEFDF